MDSSTSVPDSFRDSYLRRNFYPTNIIERTISTYPRALSEYERRLREASDALCERKLSEVDVIFRDLQVELHNGGFKELDKRKVRSPESLREWLGVQTIHCEDDQEQTTVSVTKQDPRCRFIYIYAQNARSRLKISREMLVEILTFHQVMPDYLDHLLIFGSQFDQRDLDFVSFREQMSLRDCRTSQTDSLLGRSGKQYQVCYNLKGVTCTQNDRTNLVGNQYSIRQAAVYHRFDLNSGNAVWIVTKGRRDLYERFKELTGTGARPEHRQFQTLEECLRFSLSVHFLFCHWATEDWRGYIMWLEDVIRQEDTHESETLLAVIGPVGNGSHDRMYTAKDVRNLLVWEERLNTAVTVLTSNIEIMNSLSNFYVRLKEFTESGPASRCQEDIDVFIKDLSNIINTFRLQVNRANALIKTLKDRTEMVRQHRSERLNQYMKNEAMLVRIVTIVTLVYLPATFTSTFFSTDIIKYQGQDSPGGNFSPVAMNRWLEVTVPLTFLTLLLAYAGKRGAEMESPPHWASRLRKTQWHQTTPVTPQSTDNLEAYGGSKNPVHAVASVSPV